MLLMVSAKLGQRWPPRPQTANRPQMATPANDGQLAAMTATPAADDGHYGRR